MKLENVRAGRPLVGTNSRSPSGVGAATSPDTPTVAEHGPEVPARTPVTDRTNQTTVEKVVSSRQLTLPMNIVSKVAQGSATTRTPTDKEHATVKVCKIEGCDTQAKARGWCRTHWTRWRRHGDPHTVLPTHRPPKSDRQCGECDSKHFAKGLCRTHYNRMVERRQRADMARPDETGPKFCVGCGDPPMPGGALRCLDCFHVWKAAKYGPLWGADMTKGNHKRRSGRPGVKQIVSTGRKAR